MSKSKVLLVALGVCAATVVGVQWWPDLTGPIQAEETGMSLTGEDYAQIQHLYARYAHGIDSRADNGALYASVFVPDSRFINQNANPEGEGLAGREAMIQQYGRNSDGKPNPITVSHTAQNIIIEPAAWGAVGRAIMHDGYYVDTLVKTPEGWRFRHRNYRIDFPNTVEAFERAAARRQTVP